jgi:dethiobiotin synthase
VNKDSKRRNKHITAIRARTSGISPIVFITGTDTGVGKTLLTALLLTHLRNCGVRALAIKPFSSGSLRDTRILSLVQGGALPSNEVSPFRFAAPLAPLLAARREKRSVSLADARHAIQQVAQKCDVLLVEGAGGLLAPLGERFTAVDLIAAIACPVIVAARNQLGVVNHALLTLEALRRRSISQVAFVLMGRRVPQFAAPTNRALIFEFGEIESVYEIPFLGTNAAKKLSVEAGAKKLKKTLAEILQNAMFSSASRRLRASKKRACAA